MAKINLNELAKAINVAKAMKQKEAETVFTEIYAQQPDLLGSLVTLKQIGYEQSQIQVLLNILLVTHLALQYSGLRIKLVTKEEQKAHLAHYVEHFKAVEKLEGQARETALQEYTDGHKENYLMAYVTRTMFEAGFTELPPSKGKFLIMAGTNIVNSVAGAAALKIGI